MINILIFAPFALENGRGGELSVIELAAALKNRYNITLVDTNKIYSNELLSKDFIDEKLKGIARNRINFVNFSVLSKHFGFPYPWEFIKLLKLIRRNKIVYFSLSGIGTNLLFLIYYLFNFRTNFIVGHRLPLYSSKKFSFYNIRLKISFIILSFFKKRLYHHTISFRRKKFLKYFFVPSKIYHIKHCVELEQYISENIKATKSDILKFIYVGYLDSDDKGVDILIDAINQILESNNSALNIFFEFCGKGPFETELIKLEQKFPQFVKYNGYISYEKIPEFYRRNDVFFFTSRREAFGRVIIEAMASKLLILCTRTIGSNEILKGKNFAFFLKDLTVEEIKKKICDIYHLWNNNPEKFKLLQESAKEYAIINYAYSNELNGFKNLIKSILQN